MFFPTRFAAIVVRAQRGGRVVTAFLRSRIYPITRTKRTYGAKHTTQTSHEITLTHPTQPQTTTRRRSRCSHLPISQSRCSVPFFFSIRSPGTGERKEFDHHVVLKESDDLLRTLFFSIVKETTGTEFYDSLTRVYELSEKFHDSQSDADFATLAEKLGSLDKEGTYCISQIPILFAHTRLTLSFIYLRNHDARERVFEHPEPAQRQRARGECDGGAARAA